MTKPIRLVSLAVVLSLTLLASSGCTKKARLARFARAADADFAAEHYAKAEIEYKEALGFGLNAHALGRLGLTYSREGRMPAAFACLKKSDEMYPKDADVKTALAAVYLSAHDFENGTQAAHEALSLQPTNGEAMLLIGDGVRSAKDIPPARAYLRALPGHPERIADYHVAMASLALKSRDLDGADTALRQALALDAKSDEAHYLMAQAWLQRTNLARATNELAIAADLSAWNSPIRLKAMELEFRNSGEPAARAALLNITSHAPDYIPAWVALMRMDFALKQYDDCKKTIATILEKDPENFDAALQTGVVALAQNNLNEALSAFQKVESRYPNAPEVKYYLGVASLQQGEQSKARQYFTKAVDLNTNYTQAEMILAQLDLRTQNSGAAVQRLERLIRKQPSIIEPRLLLADAYLTRQDPARALAVYRQLMDLRPNDPQLPYLMGLALARSGDLAGAGKAFAKSLELSPDFLAALERLVEVEIAQKHFDTALQTVQQHIEKNPKSGSLWLIKAGVFRAQERNDAAEEALNKAISLDATLVPAYVSLAELYVAEHKEQQALDKLNAVVGPTNDISALMSLGVIQQQVHHPEAARDAYEKLLSVNPKFMPALNNLAYVYAENLGQLDKGYLYAQKAHELRPYDPYGADTLGWILFERGEFERAQTLLQEGADGEPGDAEVQFHLGMTYYMLGQAEPARAALQNAVASLQDFAGKPEARQRLETLRIDPATASDAVIAQLEARVKADAKDPIAALRLTAIETRKGAYEKAAALCRAGLEANPRNVTLMISLAELDANHLQQPNEAFDLAKKAHSIDAENLETCALLGRLSYDHGDFPLALALLQKGAGSESASPRLNYDLARSYYEAGRVSEAEAAMQRALQPGDSFDKAAEARRFLVLVSASRSPASAQAALGQAQAALQDDPASVPALMVCGHASEGQGDYKKAAQFYEKAAATFLDFAPAARQLALLDSQHLSDDAGALRWGEKARRVFSNDAELAEALGLAAYRRADYPRSAQFLRESVAQAGENGPAQFYLGMDYFQLKQLKESKNSLRRALALNIPENLAGEARRVLAQLNK